MSTFSFFTAVAVSKQMSEANEMLTTSSTIYGILYFLFMTAVILCAAYFTTKYIAKKGLYRAHNKNLKIIETVPLGIDKTLLLVKVGEQYLLLGSTQKCITLLKEVEQEKLNIINAAEVYSNSVGENIEAYLDKLKNENGNAGANSIKHNLNKLKSIVRGNKIDV